MAASLRDLRRKIKSIKATQKITSAMQLVAASKMQRATRRAVESRPYTDVLTDLINQLAPSVDPASQPLFAQREAKTILVLLVTTNRGLAGSLNTQLLRKFMTWQKEQSQAGRTVRVVAVGTKGRQYLIRFARETLMADFQAPDSVPDFREATPVAQLLIDEFLAHKADAVYLAYNHFVSTLRQEPRIVPFLPFEYRRSNIEDRDEPATDRHSTFDIRHSVANDIVFEPSKAEILAAIVPRVLRSRIYQLLLEAHASEQSARMIAMQNATDNAGDLLGDLSLTYNSFRQAAITGELLDIAGGAAALES